jgi:hypothetical protein
VLSPPRWIAVASVATAPDNKRIPLNLNRAFSAAYICLEGYLGRLPRAGVEVAPLALNMTMMF